MPTWLFWLCLTCLCLSACGTTSTAPQISATTTPQSDQHALERWFKLDQLPTPSSVAWSQITLGKPESRAPGPSDYQVFVLLSYDTPIDLSKLELQKVPALQISEEKLPDWLPEAVLKQVDRQAGTVTFRGTSYRAEPLLAMSLSYGTLVVLDGYLILLGGTT
jgi:hypothetical protein